KAQCGTTATSSISLYSKLYPQKHRDNCERLVGGDPLGEAGLRRPAYRNSFGLAELIYRRKRQVIEIPTVILEGLQKILAGAKCTLDRLAHVARHATGPIVEKITTSRRRLPNK